MFDSVGILRRSARNSINARRYRPSGAIIFLTYRCTSRCVACNIWQRPVEIEQELKWESWKKILLSLKNAGVHSVELFGGDALLRKDLLINMITYCKELGINTFFPTNSSSLTSDTIEDLIKAGLGTVYLSLDELPDSDVSVRGVKRHFERVIKALRSFRDIRGDGATPRISCITTISRLNYRHIRKLLDVSAEAGADEHMLRGFSEFTTESVRASGVDGIKPSPYFMTTDNKSHACDPEEALELQSELNWIQRNASKWDPMAIDVTNLKNLSASEISSLRYPNQKCMFAATQVVISPYGNVIPCLYFKNYHLGNAVTNEVSSIWGNGKHRLFCDTQFSNKIPLCDHCSIKAYHQPFGVGLRNFRINAVQKIGRLVFDRER